MMKNQQQSICHRMDQSMADTVVSDRQKLTSVANDKCCVDVKIFHFVVIVTKLLTLRETAQQIMATSGLF